MIIKKTHKRKKVSRMHGRKMGTHGWGARKKHKKSGHRGGTGMAGTGKRGDSKTTLITKLYGHDYFGKKGITSRKTKKDTRQRINLQQIEKNLEKYGKKTAKGWEVNLKKYKILGEGEVKEKLIITAFAASESALKKVQKAGGQIILPEKKKTLEKKEEEE
ncbi:MAG: 50S ribosomal protein L15P [Candidatus Diapherotrites archaeon ADurb.Bin253]|jgi:large subunit ribosomal protein L15|nr:uL15 family ribosomal protein [Candidatus Pacearchaeota archaeon]OQA68100.1 MAG: 50S ribosomal protein L15P [Candidatus Diapherotrites archaeon ADurb.Bin253]